MRFKISFLTLRYARCKQTIRLQHHLDKNRERKHKREFKKNETLTYNRFVFRRVCIVRSYGLRTDY